MLHQDCRLDGDKNNTNDMFIVYCNRKFPNRPQQILRIILGITPIYQIFFQHFMIPKLMFKVVGLLVVD